MTCCRSRSFSVSLDGMVSARSIRHLTTARLLWAGLWDAQSRYLLVWVALRCTLTVMFPNLSTVLRVSRSAMVWWFWDETDGISTVNCMFGLIELRWSWKTWMSLVFKQALESSTYRFHHRGLTFDVLRAIFFNFLHHQFCNGGTNRWSHRTAKYYATSHQ